MKILILVTSLSGAGKSEVFDYIVKKHPFFHPMNTYTSRLPRHENETGYEFYHKQFFIDHKNEFVELATYPPRSNPEDEGIHYYGKHQSQFDGRNYVLAMDEVGVLSLNALSKEHKLFGYKLIKIFVTCDEKIRLKRIDYDEKREARDAKRNLLSLEFYDYVLNNDGSKEYLFKQIDEMFEKLFCLLNSKKCLFY